MIQLGQKVTDCVTGFTGVAWSRIEYLTGEVQIGVVPRAVDNNMPGVQYLDEVRLMATSPLELAGLATGRPVVRAVAEPDKPNQEKEDR